MNYENQSQRRSWFNSGRTVVLLLILTSIGVLLFTAHGAHLLGILPYLLLLACPFVHFFMHGSHGKHELRHQYSIGYRPSNFAGDGKWHRVKIRVTPPRVKAHIRSQPRRILRGWITAVTKERPFNGWQNSEGNLN